MLAVALGNMKDEKADDVLVELLDEEDLAGHALIAVARRRTEKATEKVKSLLSHKGSSGTVVGMR
jgi:HEAT repeat protein